MTAPIKMLEGACAPVDAAAGDQELFVDRLDQKPVQVACPHQFGEFVAIIKEQHLDHAVHGEETADEEEVLRLGPAGDRVGSSANTVR